jgi:hypothetical protein
MTTPQLPAATSLSTAWTAVEAARLALARWDARVDQPRTYVAEGHDAVQRIDEALVELYAARSALIAELRVDTEERDARIDALLAKYRAADGEPS